jgi:pilus assembly protein CpaE
MTVSVVGSVSAEVEQLLVACGAQVTTITFESLHALTSPEALQPDVLLVDMSLIPEIPSEIQTLRREHPSTGVLLLLPALDPQMMLAAMRAGVSECLPAPITLEDLQGSLTRLAGHRPAAKQGDVFAVVGAKGGVGATTVAVNVATMLNKLRPSSTLLIDLHITYGDAGVFLGAEPRFSIVDALENMHRMDATFLRSLITTTKSGVHLLPSADRQLSVPVDVAQVRALIELAASQYAYVVLDVPRSDSAMLDALAAVNSIVIVANQEVPTVRGAGRMAAAMQQRYGRSRVGVVITRYDEGAEIGQSDVERVVGAPVSYVFPNNYAAAVASLNKGRPLVLDNHTKLAGAFTGFTRSLANLPAERVERERPSGGFLSRISGRRR